MTNTKNDDQVLSFDMSRHAFVLAAPRADHNGVPGIGSPVVAMNGGDEATLVYALRTIADMIESGGTDSFGFRL